MSCSKEDQQHGAFERSFPVSVAVVKEKDVPVFIESIGTVSASEVVNVRPQVGGTIVDVFIKGGDDVRAGDYLYKIDPAPYQVALDIAKANLIKDQAQLDYFENRLERNLKLAGSDFVSKINIEQYKSDVKAQEGQVLIDKSQINQAQINLNYTLVMSPIDGKVSLAKIDRGNVVQANDQTHLISIRKLDPVFVDFSITQQEFYELQQMMAKEGSRTFQVLLPYDTNVNLEGYKLAFNNEVNLNTGTIQLRGVVDNAREILWPGEFVRVRLFVRIDKNMAVVPDSAVQRGQKGPFVYVVNDDSTVSYVSVVLGPALEGESSIKEGIKPGQKVVTVGQLNLKPGAKVMVVENKEENANSSSEKNKETSESNL